MKKKIDIEKLLQWALREELPKGRSVSAACAWDAITNYAALGTRIDVSPRGSGDGLGFVPGTPHQDAEAVAAAMRQLPAETRLTEAECCDLLGHWALCDPLAVRTIAGAMFNMRALVIRCGVLGSRMEWDAGTPQLQKFVYTGQRHAVIFGLSDNGTLVEVKANGRGNYPLDQEPRAHVEWVNPSVGQLLEARAEYAIWHRALRILLAVLRGALAEHEPIEPAAKAEPWHSGQVAPPVILRAPGSGKMEKLPLGPTRAAALPPVESVIEKLTRDRRAAAVRDRRIAKSAKIVAT